jgi:mannose-1-phosphate guanylyltransferase
MIGRGAVVTDSVVGSGACIGAGAVLRECVLGDGVVVAPGARLERERVANRASGT